MLLIYFIVVGITFWINISDAAPNANYATSGDIHPLNPKKVTLEDGSNYVPPTSVGRSNTELSCPAGYQLFGKHCAKSIVEAADLVCPTGYTLTDDGTCVRYTSKNSECPAGFENEEGLCRRHKVSAMVAACPNGFLMNPDNVRCTRTIEMPNVDVCPAGAIRKGDLCVVERTGAPTLACPDGFTLEGNQCRVEELYNCTPDFPPRLRSSLFPKPGKGDTTTGTGHSATPGAVQAVRIGARRRLHPNLSQRSSSSSNGEYQSQEANDATANSTRTTSPTPTRRLGVRSPFTTPSLPGSRTVPNYQIAAEEAASRTQEKGMVNSTPQPQNDIIVPVVGSTAGPDTTDVDLPRPPAASDGTTYFHDYVVQSTCSRSRLVAAQKVCKQGVLDGKVCAFDEQVSAISTYGGVVEDHMPALAECPPSYSPSATDSTSCSAVDEVPVTFYCPAGSHDLGDRCAQQTTPRQVCNTGFALEDNACVQTQLADPVVEFTVTYTCVGKNCEDAS